MADTRLYAIPATKNHPAKLPIGDALHRRLAKEALSPKGFRGNQVDASAEEKAKALKKINSYSNRMNNNK